MAIITNILKWNKNISYYKEKSKNKNVWKKKKKRNKRKV